MFTGIVEETGTILSYSVSGQSVVLRIGCSFAGELEDGESVAVNGICLTVTQKDSASFSADVTPETYRRTSLSAIENGSVVNLERAMKADGRFGGHIVSGHVDGTGRFASAERADNAVNIRIRVPQNLGRYIIEKGSVCVDGISLTVAKVDYGAEETVFEAAVIPHTWKNTSLCRKNPGDEFNIECDMVGKYIEHFLTFDKKTGDVKDSEALSRLMTDFTSFH